jgi:hypothetical protein
VGIKLGEELGIDDGCPLGSDDGSLDGIDDTDGEAEGVGKLGT